jgi:hypothetical protein
MKKAVLAILSVLYLTITSGVIVNFHYCMGRLSSVTYGLENSKNCSKCGMKAMDKKKCCHTDLQLIKLQDDQNLVKANWEFFKIPVVNPVPLTDMLVSIAGTNEYLSLKYHSPPDQRINSIYLHNSVFRI